MLQRLTSLSSSLSSNSRLVGSNACLKNIRSIVDNYGPSFKRNNVPFVDFETGYPKKSLETLSAKNPFTLIKQKKITSLLEKNPQTLAKVRSLRWLTINRVKKGGRGATGQLFVRHRGGGHKQRLRLIDFKRGRKDIPAVVLRIEYDPSHSARIALIQYEDGVLSYILAPLSTRAGDKVIASVNAPITPGNALPLSEIPIGSIIHNIEMRPGAGGQINRAAGTFAVVLSKDPEYVTVKLKSTEIRKFNAKCWATIGQLSNIERGAEVWGKAGAMVWRGFRPRVRGNAMLPNKHPHGGGVSKRHTKRPPVTFWGKPAQDFKSRSPHLPSWKDILARKNSLPKPKGYRKFNYQR